MSRFFLDTSAYSHLQHGDREVVDLRRAGSPLPTHDLWIAATVARHGALVLTYDRHFERISRVGSVLLGG